MLDFIQEIDISILLFFQSHHTEAFDIVFWYVSEAWVFLPLWIWALIQIIKQYTYSQLWKILLVVGITIVISDQTCNFFKGHFKRLRPTHTAYYQDKIHLVNHYRGGQYGFYSAHASNSAAIAVLVILFVRKHSLKYWILLYPFLSGISRMYLGVHFFTDVLFGWIMGMLVAYCVYLWFRKYLIIKPK